MVMVVVLGAVYLGIGCYSEVVVVSRATPMVAGRSAWVESMKSKL